MLMVAEACQLLQQCKSYQRHRFMYDMYQRQANIVYTLSTELSSDAKRRSCPEVKFLKVNRPFVTMKMDSSSSWPEEETSQISRYLIKLSLPVLLLGWILAGLTSSGMKQVEKPTYSKLIQLQV